MQPVRAVLTRGPPWPEMGGSERIALKKKYFSNQENQEDACVYTIQTSPLLPYMLLCINKL